MYKKGQKYTVEITMEIEVFPDTNLSSHEALTELCISAILSQEDLKNNIVECNILE